MRTMTALLLSLGLAALLAGCSGSPTPSGYSGACYGPSYAGYRGSYYGYNRGYRQPYFGYGGYGAHRSGC